MERGVQALCEFADVLIQGRQNVSPKRLLDPGPTSEQLQRMLQAAAAAPDHGQLLPWRFVLIPPSQRSRLAEAFARALLERDPIATPEQVEQARSKAYRAPCLMLAIARLAEASPAHDGINVEVNDAERLVSLGCAIQNMLLCAHAAGFGTGLTSGQAMTSSPLRALFQLKANEQAVCCVNIGTVSHRKSARIRPEVARFFSSLC